MEDDPLDTGGEPNGFAKEEQLDVAEGYRRSSAVPFWENSPTTVEDFHTDEPSDPSHDWTVVDVKIKGRGSLTTFAVEQCAWCDKVRVNRDIEYIGAVGEVDR